MSDQQKTERAKEFLAQFGHFDNPNYAEAQGAKRSVAMLSHTDNALQQAALSLAEMDANFDDCQRAVYGHLRPFDGDVRDPAFQQLMAIERCGRPDHGPESHGDIATSELFDPNAAVISGGSWLSCDPERSDVNSIRIGVERRGMPYSEGFFWSFLKHTIAAAAEYGLAARYILDAPKSECEIYVTFQRLAGYIGWNEFGPVNSCDRTINGRISTTWLPENPLWHASLWAHEQLGHGIGLQHRSGGGSDSNTPSYMNPSVRLFNPLTFKGDRHERSWVTRFGGKPLSDGPDVPTIKILDSNLRINILGQLVDLELKPLTVVEATDTGRVKIVDGIVGLELDGTAYKFQLIDHADF